MNVPGLLYALLTVVLLSSCSQWKSVTSRDTSSATRSSQKSTTKKVQFLDNIAVNPGHANADRHSTGDAMVSADIRKKQRDSYNSIINPAVNAGDIERADWLQLKYAIVLDATVEKLTNVNLLKIIDEWWGTGYCSGGSTKDCIDCSAFTHIIMQNIYNVNIPRTAQEQYNASQHINLQDLNEGDLVFFHTSGREMSHVGVYLLNNKFVHAASSGGVMVSDLNDPYWKPRFKAAGRYVASTAALNK